LQYKQLYRFWCYDEARGHRIDLVRHLPLSSSSSTDTTGFDIALAPRRRSCKDPISMKTWSIERPGTVLGTNKTTAAAANEEIDLVVQWGTEVGISVGGDKLNKEGHACSIERKYLSATSKRSTTTTTITNTNNRSIFRRTTPTIQWYTSHSSYGNDERMIILRTEDYNSKYNNNSKARKKQQRQKHNKNNDITIQNSHQQEQQNQEVEEEEQQQQQEQNSQQQTTRVYLGPKGREYGSNRKTAVTMTTTRLSIRAVPVFYVDCGAFSIYSPRSLQGGTIQFRDRQQVNVEFELWTDDGCYLHIKASNLNFAVVVPMIFSSIKNTNTNNDKTKRRKTNISNNNNDNAASLLSSYETIENEHPTLEIMFNTHYDYWFAGKLYLAVAADAKQQSINQHDNNEYATINSFAQHHRMKHNGILCTDSNEFRVLPNTTNVDHTKNAILLSKPHLVNIKRDPKRKFICVFVDPY